MVDGQRRTPAQIAKEALRRLAQAQQEPTPENYARAYALESGQDAAPARQPDPAAGNKAQAEELSRVIERMVRGLERGGRSWTLARKKDGVSRVLAANRSDIQRMVARLSQLVSSWDSDGAPIGTTEEPGGTPSQFFVDEEFGPASRFLEEEPAPLLQLQPSQQPTQQSSQQPPWPEIETSLHTTVQHALRNPVGHGEDLIAELDAAQRELLSQGATPERAAQMELLCQRARHLLDHRQHLFAELGTLCRELSASIVELAEDDSWAQGQAAVMNDTLSQGLSGRGVRTVSEMLLGTRTRQRQLRDERSRARESLKLLIQRMLAELGELGQHTDRFQNNVGRYAEAVEKADSLESLAGTVREMVEESRSVQSLVHQTQERLTMEHDRASELAVKVTRLEDELRKLSNEVQTDQLTQIANRRGLIAAFETEQAKAGRDATRIALALLDIDNFKKLNDTLGHAAGDVALKMLAERCTQLLRPGDMVARYGGEEFVLLLPATPLDEAQSVLLRLQRSLTKSLFNHDGKDVFVTFSAGVTLYRPGETLEAALDRADMALYEAKHTGKNKACVAP
ncbi:GGDEF domain-containing protein [Paucibacter sp. R3-3]|uniref:diguanylate cyclase n=1 Tax=Roseateles agri TaxID=3098619 RepID=A0ABU5DRM9_9BURK|nr:GGDEF domain-containing protein [Paucibacter sp. R3-3]MDY0748366.1 GGDEF domain-containing protein [Paucibacter sp. R3-3]